MLAPLAVVCGHSVKTPSFVSLGGDEKWLAYVTTTNTFVVCGLCDTRGNATSTVSSSEADFISSSRTLELPESQTISLLHIHPSKDLLCVGTTGNGVYITAASSAAFGAETTRLPPRVSGEGAVAACFVDGFPDAADALVVSSAFREGPRHVFRLSLWDVTAVSLLWRGYADEMESIAALPGRFGFVSCTRQEVSLWTVTQSTVADTLGSVQRRDESCGSALTVLSKPCSGVSELRGAEFVAIVPPTHDETTVTALTAAGFLVSFDLHNGTAVKWMDCKVCPAITACRAGGNIVVCGSLVRLFAAQAWEFRGKLKPIGADRCVAASSFLTRLTDTFCGGAVAAGDAVALFFKSGELARYRLVAPTASASSKWAFRRVYHYAPVGPEETPLRFFAMADGGFCLWSPRCVRRFDAALRLLGCVALEGTCAAHHPALDVLLVYDASAYEVVALPVSLRGGELGRLAVAEPLVCLAASGPDEFAGLSPDNTLFRFGASWAEGRRLALRPHPPARLGSFAPPLTHLAAAHRAGGALLAASSCAVVDLRAPRERTLPFSGVLDLAGDGGGAVLVRCRGSCAVLDARRLAPVGDALVAAELREAIWAPGGGHIALRDDIGAAVWRPADWRCVERVRPRRPPLRGFGFAADGAALFVCDADGRLARHALSAPFGARRSRSCGAPSSAELRTRFADLRGYYTASRRPPRSTPSSSGVLILARGDTILRLADRPSPPPQRRWGAAAGPTELPRVEEDASTLRVSALTSERSVGASGGPPFGALSPARRGDGARSPTARTPEDDVVNGDSWERDGATHRDPNAFAAAPRSESARATSWELCDGLRALTADGADAMDDDTADELYAAASRLCEVLQARQGRRPGSAQSHTSDTSTGSVQSLLVELQRMQLQNNRIESQNKEILSRLNQR